MPRNTTSEAGEMDADPNFQPSPPQASPLLDKEGARGWLTRLLDFVSTTPRPSSAQEGSPSLDRWAIPLLLIFSVALYISTCAYDLVGDDAVLIGSNPYVKSFHFLREIFTQSFWSFQGARGDSMFYRPLVMFSFLLQAQLFGSRPGAFHLFNVLLNAWVVVMVYQFGKRFWPKGGGALWGALIFAALPVHTEAVATVSGISDLECAAFTLAALLIYTQPLGEKGFTRTRAWMSALVFLLAALSKEVALSVPVLMVIYEHFLRRDPAARFLKRLSRYLPTLIVSVFYIVVHLAVIGDLSSVGPRQHMHLRESLIFGFTQVGEYAGKLLWPQHLSYSWSFHPPLTWREPAVLLGILFMLWGVGMAVAWWRRDTHVSFAIIWFFLTLAPALNIAGVGVAAYGERYLYIPSVGLCWLTGQALGAMTGMAPGRHAGWRAAATALGLVLLLAASLRTLVRLPAWRNNFTLGLATVREDPNAAVFHVYLGNAYRAEGRRSLARIEYLEAMASDARAGEAFVNLAGVLIDDGNSSAAEDVLRRCTQLNPAYSKPPFVLGKLARDRGNKEEARDLFARALERDPNDMEALFALGLLSFEEGRLDEAATLLSRAATVEPSSALIRLNLGAVFSRQKKFADAETAFRQALQLAPNSEAAYLALAGLYEDQGKQAAALELYRRVVRAAPDSANAQFRLGVLALRMGKVDESIAALGKAVEAQPGSALAHAQLGLAYLQSGNPEGARHEIEAAKRLDPKDDTVKMALGKLNAYAERGPQSGNRREP